MFNSIINFLRKRVFLRNIKYLTDESEVIFGNNVQVHLNDNSNITISGKVLMGIPLTGLKPGYSHKDSTVLTLAKNATLIIHDDVHIAPGCTIRIGENATLELGGKNVIAHDTIIIATKKVYIGKNTSISWNCNLIDDDAHSFYRADGKKIIRFRKPLTIGNNVGIQMNVVIPSGGTIGDNSIISANTVIRSNIPKDTLVYTLNENKLISNFTTGFQFK